MADLATSYTKFRGSFTFLLLLSVVISGWLGLHFAFGIDSDFGALNLFLSSEASVSLALFTMLSDKQAADQAAVMAEIQRLGRASLVAAEAQHKILTDLSELLKLEREEHRDA